MTIRNIIALLAIGILFPSVSHAYVDPGSGSVIVTAILGFLAAIGYTSRKYFYKFKRLLFGRVQEGEHHATEKADEEQ